MKPRLAVLLTAYLVLVPGTPSVASQVPTMEKGGVAVKPGQMPKPVKPSGVLQPTTPPPLRVKQVVFKTTTVNNQLRLAASIVFNKNVDPASMVQNVNVRMIRINENHFWVDASKQNNVVNVWQNTINWLSGAPLLSEGIYKMYLHGTLKSTDGQYLDCDGDGKGEGGYPPPYESQLYQAPRLLQVQPKDDVDKDLLDRLRGD